MIIFDQLRISYDKSKLYINVHVNEDEAFDNIYLKKLTIKIPSEVSEMAPELADGEFVYQETIDGEEKTASWVITPAMMNEHFVQADFSKCLFFVYVECKASGSPNPCFECLPCSMQQMTTLGIVFDITLLHQKVMGYTKELNMDCVIPQHFIDFILQWNAFKASIETGHYIPAINFYNMMFGDLYNSTTYNTNSRCGCHG